MRYTTDVRYLQLIIFIILIAAENSSTTDRRGFFRKIRDAYLQGRYSAEEKRIVERQENEKMRRRLVRERNVKTVVDGIAKKLKTRPSHVRLYVFGGLAVVIWLCYRGSVGCNDNDKDD